RRPDVEHIELDVFDVGPALGRLLAPAPPDLAATWVVDSRSVAGDRNERWSRLLRRLNERRDALRAARPSALLFACPPGSLPMVRDAAPDLWSFRGLTATLTPDSVTSPAASAPVAAAVDRAQSWLSPVAGDPVMGSPPVADALRRAASALRSGLLDLALSSAEAASAAAEDTEDTALVHAWLAQIRDGQGEPTEAVRHATLALAAEVPFEQATTETVLRILVESAQPAVAEQAGVGLVRMHRTVVERQPDNARRSATSPSPSTTSRASNTPEANSTTPAPLLPRRATSTACSRSVTRHRCLTRASWPRWRSRSLN
ncbi:MAG: hypothetical protein M3Z25_09540, partial [Actinomycetota bacterium]|nr:hypothetical protein [Actinomycetota bacterium]